MNTTNYWPWSFDTDGEIYDSPAWDLPGLRRRRRGRNPGRQRVERPRSK